MVKEGMDLLNMTGFITFRPLLYLGLVDAYCAAGKVEEGLQVVHEAEAFSDDTGGHRFSSPIQKIKGDLLVKKKDEAGAEEAYRNAISIARQQEAKMLELQAAIQLSRLWKNQAKQEQSAKLLQPIYDWFSEGFDSPWLIEAGDLLESISSEN